MRYFTLTLLFVAFAGFALKANAKTLRLIEGSKPTETQIAPYKSAFCSSLPGTYRFCRVLINDEAESEFILQQKGDIVSKINAPFWGTANAPPDQFVSYRCDLDNDGVQELILVSHEGVSNGMGVTYSTIYIFRDPIKFPNTSPVSIPIQEFGRRDSVVYDKQLQRYLILATHWREYASLDKRRGWGTYLVGKWFQYRQGRLEPLLNRPTLARRFLNSFASERDNGWFENREPYRWLHNRTTHRLFREPTESAKLESTETAVVTEVSNNGEDNEIKVKIGSETKAFTYAAMRTSTNRIRSMGIWSKRYLFPESFDPAFYYGSLVGKRMRIETYRDEFDSIYRILWFKD